MFLGRPTDYPERYSPELLCAIPRAEQRRALALGEHLPFHGDDLWNAWEITWLDPRGKPLVATGVIRVPADSPNLIESKSFKLYLNSLSMTRFAATEEVAAVITGDLSKCAAVEVHVALNQGPATVSGLIHDLPGICIDTLDVECDTRSVDPSLLNVASDKVVSEALHSHLLRSLCPVTDQPDLGSILVRYRGPAIDRSSLLRYVASYRRHNDFHEVCVERIFVDLKERCAPAQLTVYARYNRRGGLDINPFRSDFETGIDNLRLWRQ